MNKKLRIAQIAPLWISIPPQKYGGIERIVFWLCEELTKRGHKVTLFASGDSKTSAKLVSVYPRGLLKDKVPWTDPFWNLENLSLAFRRTKEFDIIHSHLDLWTLFFQELTKVPVVHTTHNPLYISSITDPKRIPTRLKMFKIHRKTTNAVFISKSQRRLCPVKFPQNKIIYNGIDVSKFKFNPKPKDYFVWIARIDKYKGIENAIKAAEITGVKLLLAGRLDPFRKEYFKEKIKPHLSKKIKYIGELSKNQLSDFYGGAKACLYPIEWEEPFGLIVVEAMACGTPVIAFNHGSMPELITKDTGFVVNNISEMVRAIKKVDKIDREKCRQRVEKYFTYSKMVDEYEKLYYSLIKK
ncbi:MAG: glycosyl transferase [Parcubacteria group bacterium CG11_big_fil_rev_8_21_14_0_20_39_14]|nr:MAG: glycosyl transferase [Parcubacteria group bacterium CG11_big_fil_rev_8_21_14_0_20_39_14]PIS35187.1 MAG: glycosyl transferase [Parcubacteria group bacterium CG08_land_8_20_14_0_20_38_56]